MPAYETRSAHNQYNACAFDVWSTATQKQPRRDHPCMHSRINGSMIRTKASSYPHVQRVRVLHLASGSFHFSANLQRSVSSVLALNATATNSRIEELAVTLSLFSTCCRAFAVFSLLSRLCCFQLAVALLLFSTCCHAFVVFNLLSLFYSFPLAVTLLLFSTCCHASAVSFQLVCAPSAR